jgi:hypothetical protein
MQESKSLFDRINNKVNCLKCKEKSNKDVRNVNCIINVNDYRKEWYTDAYIGLLALVSRFNMGTLSL